MSQRILLLSPFFFPEPISTGKYNTYIAKELVKTGDKLDVISFHPLYPEWISKPSNLTLPGMNIYRGGTEVKYPHSQYLRRFYLEVWYTLFSLSTILRNKKEYDIVIPIFPPSLFCIFVPLLFKKGTKIRGIIHDLQGIYAGSSNNIIVKILFNIISFIETIAFKKCEKLIFLSREMESYVQNNYGISPKATTVHYPFFNVKNLSTSREKNSSLNSGDSNLKNIFKDRSCYHIVYSGALGSKQYPEGLLNFFQLISEIYSDITCHIFSAGPIFDKYKKRSNQGKNTGRINFHPLVSENSVAELYHYSSCQIIPQKSGTSSGSLPSKLPNLVNCCVPIFCICDMGSEISNIIKTNSLGEISHSWELNDLKLRFSDFRNSYLENLDSSFQVRSSKVAKELFDISNIMKTLVE